MKKDELTCPWCTYNEGCDKSDCDFRTLKYEKDAIITRIKEERENLSKLREQILERGDILDAEEMEGMINTSVDLTKGIQIMSSRLQSDFGMSLEELKNVIGVEEKSFGDRMRLMAAIRRMKKSRGKKK